MLVKKEWRDVVVTKIGIAVYVASGVGKSVHNNRPLHGLVLNEENAVKEYCFSDGRVMRTEGRSLFYLPKSSSYVVKAIEHGGCYAINFDAEIDDEPFTVSLKDTEALQRTFRTACSDWKGGAPSRTSAAMKAVYDAICHLVRIENGSYMSSERYDMIAPAMEILENDFADHSLSVASLAALCGMSEVYFRKIFLHKLGVSPKEYVIRKRIEYAKHLLSSGQFEVSEVAELCGYGEPCLFSREFKKRNGVAPKDYK